MREMREMGKIEARLISMGACSAAGVWVASLPPETTEEAAWSACGRADWLLWVAVRLGVDRPLVVLAACACARTALPVWEQRYPEDRRPHTAIETAEAWARGEASLEQVQAAAAAVFAAAYAAYAAYADAAAAAGAADAAAAAACADYASRTARAYAAHAAYAASAAAAAASRTLSDLVRQHIPWSAVVERLTD